MNNARTYGILAVCLLAVLLSSCKTCEPIVETIEKERIVEVHTRDTAIVTQADSASVHALLRCDSAYNVILDELVTMQGDRIEAELHMQQMQGGGVLLKMDCKEDSLINEIQLRDSVISNFKKETVVVREKYVPDYYKRTSTGFWILLAILVLICGWKIAKICLKVQSGGIL